jgi:hypothetical protein
MMNDPAETHLTMIESAIFDDVEFPQTTRVRCTCGWKEVGTKAEIESWAEQHRNGMIREFLFHPAVDTITLTKEPGLKPGLFVVVDPEGDE